MRRVLPSIALAAVALAAPHAAGAAVKPIGRIVIPKIGLDTAFFNGQSTVDTDHGPAHYPWTGMPGQGRTVAIAGHRVTHTHPFRQLGELQKHDLIEIRYGARPRFGKLACYRVTGSAVVSPAAVWVTKNVSRERLVLTTCTPPGSATFRLVIDADRARCG
jgi:sortase A